MRNMRAHTIATSGVATVVCTTPNLALDRTPKQLRCACC
jgi:hypothetical protein